MSNLIYSGYSCSSGIYVIFNQINWKLYIGSTVEFKNRWTQGHLKLLRKGTHHCKHLQASWNKHGEDAFEFHVVENMPGSTREERLKREEEWIEIHWGKGNLYNGTKKALSREGKPSKNPEETSAKISIATRKQWSNPLYREKISSAMRSRIFTEEHRFNLANSARKRTTGYKCSNPKIRKLTSEDVNFIRINPNKQTFQDMATKFNMSIGSIYQIFRGRTYKDIPMPLSSNGYRWQCRKKEK